MSPLPPGPRRPRALQAVGWTQRPLPWLERGHRRYGDIFPLRIRHYGYLKARIEERDKNRRNLELLQRELQRDPANPFTLFNVGTEYVSLGEHERARAHLEQAHRVLDQRPAWWEFAFAPLTTRSMSESTASSLSAVPGPAVKVTRPL